MGQTTDASAESTDRVVESYVADVRIVEYEPEDGDEPRYRFEAPQHVDVTFEDRETATLYADVYFDVNGFREDGTGRIGIPPEIVQAGKDTLAAYMLTQPDVDEHWVVSFYGMKYEDLERYRSWVRERAEEIRATARDEGVE